MTVYCVFGEVNERYGTSELIAVCATPQAADEVGIKEHKSQQFGRRFYVCPMTVLTDAMQYKS